MATANKYIMYVDVNHMPQTLQDEHVDKVASELEKIGINKTDVAFIKVINEGTRLLLMDDIDLASTWP